MAGALGPLQSFGVTGHLEWALMPIESGARLELSYIVGGYAPMGFEQLSEAVSGVLREQLTRLVRYVETGAAAPSRAPVDQATTPLARPA